MLSWNEKDFARFFGGEADDRDRPHALEYTVARDGLRLAVTVLAIENTVVLRLFREGLPEAIFSARLNFCSHAHITKGAGFRPCFEAGVPAHPVTDPGLIPVLNRGIRVYLEPQLQVELIKPRYEAA